MRYPGAVRDPDTGAWISDAEVAEIAYTAFASTKDRITARLMVRRVKDARYPDALFPVWRYHPFFTNTDLPVAEADITHRQHAIIETVFADLIDGPLAHMPSGRFGANSAWVLCAAIAHNLLRAAGVLAGDHHTRARGSTLRRQIVNIPARLARPQRRPILHLPTHWPWSKHWLTLWHNTIGLQPTTDPRQPDHPAERPDRSTQEKLGRPAATPCPHPTIKIKPAHTTTSLAHRSGSRGESHPPAPTDPCVTVSRHTALVILVIRRTGPRAPMSSARTCGDTARRSPAASQGLLLGPQPLVLLADPAHQVGVDARAGADTARSGRTPRSSSSSPRTIGLIRRASSSKVWPVRSVQSPGPHLRADPLQGVLADRRQERDEHLPVPVPALRWRGTCTRGT